MSDELAGQSRLRAGVTRRTALRGAVWTASAVTVVVAAPAYAAASTVQLTGSVTSTAPWKQSDARTKHVLWDITVTNTSAVPMTGITVDYALADKGAGLPTALAVTGGGAPWSVNNVTDLVATYNGTIPAGGSITFRADFITPNNAAGAVSAVVRAGTTILGSTGDQDF